MEECFVLVIRFQKAMFGGNGLSHLLMSSANKMPVAKEGEQSACNLAK